MARVMAALFVALAAAATACAAAPTAATSTADGRRGGALIAVTAAPPTKLRVDFLPPPSLGVSLTPRFSFTAAVTVDDTDSGAERARGARMAACRVVVFLAGHGTAVWDSGPLARNNGSSVPYGCGSAGNSLDAGTPPLAPGTRYVWSAAWLPAGQGAKWSDFTSHSGFVTGLCAPRVAHIRVQRGLLIKIDL